jgi:hypothetical protein
MSMKVDLRVGEALRFDNGRIVVTLLEKSGQRARVSVEADDSVAIQVPYKDGEPASRWPSFGTEKMLAGSV